MSHKPKTVIFNIFTEGRVDIVGRDQHGGYGSVGVSVGSHEPGNQQPMLVRRQRKTHSKASRLQVVFSRNFFRITQT